MTTEQTHFIRGGWVKRAGHDRIGRVLSSVPGANGNISIEWLKSRQTAWVPAAELHSGIAIGMVVQDVPRSRFRPSLGEGEVIEVRKLGGCEQALVEFSASDRRVWLPWQNLRPIRGVRQRFLLGQADGDAEALRLRSLAHALELWNENTGSLSHLDIDPLPHQIHLVHHILASGNLNWLIADDVGLGKTIEVGMLLAALKQRGMFRRILLVTPAGLTRQWQEELRYKFGMDDFQIYGEDFSINDPVHWKLHDHVIGSMDRFKSERHLNLLLQAGFWDLVVFDEAHRLSRRQYGMKIDASDRFRLAAALREQTDSLLLLSATPHQGMADKFKALLELLRPEWKADIGKLEQNPEVLQHLVIRNHKADVTDAAGEFIFKGKTTKAIQVHLGEEARNFDQALQQYLKRGYAAGQTASGMRGRAIGFVMTVYRKLAASSAAAIHAALKRRLGRLRESAEGDWGMVLPDAEQDGALDLRFEGEAEETMRTASREFFTGEIDALIELIAKAADLLRNDLKLQAFMEEMVNSVLQHNSEEKVVIFSEYRATQDYLADALGRRFGAERVELINGSLNLPQRADAIARFEDSAQFLISTEAGGEGINLHRHCHVMVNFDLPWNPMRLVQRIGRLYRYGQQQRVVVFNVHAPQTIDAQIMDLMFERIQKVVADMSVLGGEYNERLSDEILGEFADLIDVGDILEQATTTPIARTRERIEQALQRARDATAMQRELFESVTAYDPSAGRHEIAISVDHQRRFVRGMFQRLGIKVVKTIHNGAVWDLKLPEAVSNRLPGKRGRLRVTFDRAWAANRADVHALDLDSALMKLLLAQAKDYDAGGLAAPVAGLRGRGVLTAILRWQNDQGLRLRQEFTGLLVHKDGRVETNPPAFSQWLLADASAATATHDRALAKPLFAAAQRATDQRLGEVANNDLHPQNREWVGAGWND